MQLICYDRSVPETHSFSIRTEVFEGPLDILLELIEKRKLLINDISLASVTDEYMAYVTSLDDHPLRETAQFVLVASTLLLIKSRSLLPVLTLTNEEEAAIEDLEHRLKLYQIYRNASAHLKSMYGSHTLYERPYQVAKTPLFIPDRFTNTGALREAMLSVLTNLPKKKHARVNVSVKTIVSLEDMMKRLEKRIMHQFKIGFRDFSGNAAERPQVIVSFLAVLELVKQGIVMVRQEARYADFQIEREGVDTPNYS